MDFLRWGFAGKVRFISLTLAGLLSQYTVVHATALWAARGGYRTVAALRLHLSGPRGCPVVGLFTYRILDTGNVKLIMLFPLEGAMHLNALLREWRLVDDYSQYQ